MEVTADGEATRRTFSEYWPGGELRSRRTERAYSSNDTVERWFRFSDGRLSRLDRKRQGATGFAKEQAYDYDLNGNRILDERGTHEFNSRDQLVRWTKVGGGQVDYVLNGSGAVTSRTDGSMTTDLPLPRRLKDPGLASRRAAVETIAHELNHIRGVMRSGVVTEEPVAEARARAAGRHFRP
jgi:hypothetical protein